ncbi:GNAT family N-acetyltransferase [Ureibacillus chungkukjangi]|uniref:L-amino acid N-acyltransferase YncA n=1 Tax=Ureibacillus chungkukjangi TaxID=1202712 RepID=A0A318TU52_9BACL|nr:GNAT family N-acetyltransferase [Ureibacillus chungkukjangi]PYF08322.1 L-amino acid N-acyltransferase YncA [Ureibacillus chungkukjangi]
MQVRKAVMADAAGIAKVHVDSWQTTYRGIIPDDFLNKLSYEQRTELWKRNISEVDNYVAVAEDEEGKIIGFASASKREENSTPNSSDLTSIYLLEEYQGQGIGKNILQHIFVHFKSLGLQKIFVDVLAENKTRHFYEYYGAKLYSTTQIKIGGKVLDELIYEWDSVDEVLERLKKVAH